MRAPLLRIVIAPGMVAAVGRPAATASAAPVEQQAMIRGVHLSRRPRGPLGSRRSPAGRPVRPTPRRRPVRRSAGRSGWSSRPSAGRSGLESLGLLRDRTLEAPHEWGLAGWYADGGRPGDPGPAVIAEHIESVNGPAVFYRLRDLRPGARATVYTRDGKQLTFVVDDVRSYPKTKFPTGAVSGPTPLPELRLITCTGDFDWTAHSYVDNLVVTARLA